MGDGLWLLGGLVDGVRLVCPWVGEEEAGEGDDEDGFAADADHGGY